MSEGAFCPIDELFQPMLHQPPDDRHGDDIGYDYLDKERTVQQADDAEGRCSMHLADGYFTETLADGIPRDAEQSEAGEKQGYERIGVQHLGQLYQSVSTQVTTP